MKNDLATLQKAMAPALPQEDQLLEKGLLGGKYLPQLRLCSSGALVTDHNIKPGNYCLVQGDNVENLGAKVDFIPLTHRAKAVDYEAGVNSYDMDSNVFMDIKDRAGEKDSGCVYGLEFLAWLPSCEKFVVMFCNSASLRRASSGILAREFKGVHGESNMVEGKKKNQKWAVPVWSDIDPEIQLNIPEADKVKEQITKFLEEAKKSDDVELADDDSGREL